jgi:hypothetical protein
MRSGAGPARGRRQDRGGEPAAAGEVGAFVRLAVAGTAEPRIVRRGEDGQGAGQEAGRLGEDVIADRGVHGVPGCPVGYRRVGVPGTGAG